MSSIKLRSTGGGSVIIRPASTGADVNVVVPATNGSLVAAADLVLSSGAAGVGYLPAGTGASTTRSVQDKLREAVSILDFGASTAATATTNTAAIAAALAYAGTKKCGVYVPSDSAAYQINDEFVVPAGVTVFGDGWGSFIQQTTLNKDVFIAGNSNTFHNLRLKIADGNNADFVNCIYASGVRNLTIESCFLELGDLGGCGIHVRGVQNSQIRGNRIYGGNWSSGAGGAAASASDILFYSASDSERHIIEGNQCLSNNSQGIFVSALGFDGDVIISNNMCVTLDSATCTETGTWALATAGGRRRHGIVLSYVNSQPGRPRIVVDGNICRNTRWTGIYKQGTSDNEVIISNNLCDLNGYETGNSLSGGIYVESPGRSSVVGNTITNFQNNVGATGGITINQASSENLPALINGNKIVNSLASGIALGTFARLVTITNNLIIGSTASDIYSVNADGSAVVGGHTIANNIIQRTSGTSVPAIYYEQQASTRYATIRDNNIEGYNNANAAVENAGIRLREARSTIQVFGNTIRNFYYGMTCASYYVGRLPNNVISRNKITDCAVGFGLSATNNDTTLPLVDNIFVNTPTKVSGPIGVTAGRIVQQFGDKFVWQSTAAPSVGTWEVGDRSVNSAPAVGQPKAWTCTVAGAPGTWVSEGNL